MTRRLLETSLTDYRNGRYQRIAPLHVFNASKVAEAFAYFKQHDRLGKIAISLEEMNSPLNVSF